MSTEQQGGPDAASEATLRRIVDAWPQRAAVVKAPDATSSGEPWNPELPDYPPDLVPFAEHPRFLAAAPEQREQVRTGLWLGYNERVIATEQLVAEPGFHLVMAGGLAGSDAPLMRQAIQQALVDESFHTYLHMTAHQRTMRLRGIRERPGQPVLVTYRRLQQMLAELPEAWERDIAVLTWSVVAETCINALLALVARDREIQPVHSLITTLHLRDESAHGSILVHVMCELYARMNPAQREMVARCLPVALAAFAEQDRSVLRLELVEAGIEGADEILGDLAAMPQGRQLVRDFSGARRLVAELGLTDRVDFTFPEQPEWSPVARPDEFPDLPAQLTGPAGAPH
ncbi:MULTISPECIES: diiron oxygenase [unclassified Streptomyces]|uniref:diiron oxygenase n=1 Tax=unclassified Streptomyces TaxID=2593676 RepID=UPI002E29083A|nr:diiron oxygenase [Streptomyces sp. NBC_01429]